MKKNMILPEIKYNVPERYPIYLTDEELYSFGGWLKENAGNLVSTAAGAGLTIFGGPAGAAAGVGMMAGGVGGMLGNAFAEEPETIDYSKETRMPRTVGKENMTPNVMSFKYGGIHIKEANKGKFTAKAKKAGKGVQEYARYVLAHKDKFSSATVKQANFARNAKKFKHQEGGPLFEEPTKTTTVIKNMIPVPLTSKQYKNEMLDTGFINDLSSVTPQMMEEFANKYPDQYSFFPRQYDKKGKALPMGTANPEGKMYKMQLMDVSNPRTSMPGLEDYYKLAGLKAKGGKIEKVMHEFKHGELHSGSKTGPIVTDRDQAIAIALSEERRKKKKDFGGSVDDNISAEDNNLIQLEGPSHEEGGIQFTPDAEVEGGETVFKDVVNSDSIEITDEVAEEYGLPDSAIGKTVAEYSKIIEKKYEGRDIDPFAMKSRELELNNLAKMSMDLSKQYNDEEMMRNGGKIKYQYGNDKPITNESGKIHAPLGMRVLFNYIQGRQRSAGVPINLGMFENLREGTPGWAPDTGANWKDNYFDTPNYVGFGIPGYAYNMNRGRGMDQNLPQGHITGAQPLGIGPLNVPSDIGFEDVITPEQAGYGYEEGQGTVKTSNRIPDIPIMDVDINGIENENARMLNRLTTPLPEGKVSTDNLSVPQLSDATLDNTTLAPAPDISRIKNYKGNVSGVGKFAENYGADILGAVPLAMSAFMSARTAKEGYDKVKLGRIHAEEFNPALIDPGYQLDTVSDVYNTANRQMESQSKTDFLRRRIQSATEEAKTKSGVLGQVKAANVQMLNQAKELGQRSRLSADVYNLQAQMQEEQINAANKGAYQTARDYQLANLGTMAGEVGRDIKLTQANKETNEKYLNTLNEYIKQAGIQFDQSGNMTRIPNMAQASAPFAGSDSVYGTKFTSPYSGSYSPEDSVYPVAEMGNGINNISGTRGNRYLNNMRLSPISLNRVYSGRFNP